MKKFKVSFTTVKDNWTDKKWKTVLILADTVEEAEQRTEQGLNIFLGDQFYKYYLKEVK